MKEDIDPAVVAARKQKAYEVLFDDPKVAAALERVNVFVGDCRSNSKRISESILPSEDHFDSSGAVSHFKWLDYVHPDDRERVTIQWKSVWQGSIDSYEDTYRFLTNGEYRWISHRGTMVYRSEEGEPELYIAADLDITEEYKLRKLLEIERERLAKLVIKDDFLDIPNRRYLETKQSQFFITDGKTPVSVLVLDLDNFKQLNTELTHKGGDKVLQETVKVIKNNLRYKDVVARYGGDEFVVVLPECSFQNAEETAQTIMHQVSLMHFSWSKDLSFSISVGLYHGYPDSSQNFWGYFEEADKLLLEAKRSGKAQMKSQIAPQ